jgi:tetratricopeptide (TPR) repeat protein
VKTMNAGGNNQLLVEAARELAHLYELDNRVQDALDVWGYVSKQVPGDREASMKWRDLSAKNVTNIIETASKDGKRGSMARLTQTDEQKKAASKLDLEKGDIKSEADLEAIVKHTRDEIAAAPPEDRNVPKLYEKLGLIYRQFGRYDDAKTAFEAAREKEPNNPSYLFKLHDLEIAKLQSELKALEPQVRAGEPVAREQYVKLRDSFLDYRLTSYLDREKQYPTDSKIRFDLGSIYFDLAEKRKDKSLYDEALKRFQSTFKDPKFRVESGQKLGICFDAKGQFDLALKRYDETLAGFPAEIRDERWKTLMYFKAMTLIKSGRIEDALKILYEIYEVDVSFKDVGKKIEELEARKG